MCEQFSNISLFSHPGGGRFQNMLESNDNPKLLNVKPLDTLQFHNTMNVNRHQNLQEFNIPRHQARVVCHLNAVWINQTQHLLR